jgi:hypothetical protein
MFVSFLSSEDKSDMKSTKFLCIFTILTPWLSFLLIKHQNSLEFPPEPFVACHAQGLIKAERTYSGVRLYDINHVLSSPANTTSAPSSAASSASLAPTERPSK